LLAVNGLLNGNRRRGHVKVPKSGDARSHRWVRRKFNVSSSLFLLLVAEMRAFTIAAIIAVLTLPAHAQMGRSKGGGGKLGQKSDEQIAAEQQKKKNEENAYKDALKKIPDAPAKQKDPWSSMR
jgi:hypothetical protein